METKWASLVSYDVTADLLKDALPVDEKLNDVNIRNQVLQVAERMEQALAEERDALIEGCELDWERLPMPDGLLTVGIDGGFARAQRKGETISTAFVESTVNQVVSKRMVKRQQMQWSQRGAHLLQQMRTRVLNDDLEDTFRPDRPRGSPGRAWQRHIELPEALAKPLLELLLTHRQHFGVGERVCRLLGREEG